MERWRDREAAEEESGMESVRRARLCLLTWLGCKGRKRSIEVF